jgi:hypothetical protein
MREKRRWPVEKKKNRRRDDEMTRWWRDRVLFVVRATTDSKGNNGEARCLVSQEGHRYTQQYVHITVRLVSGDQNNFQLHLRPGHLYRWKAESQADPLPLRTKA